MLLLLIVVIAFSICIVNGKENVNIIVIIADDLGWNDVSFHGSNQIPTPNLDALAYNGISLQKHYTLPTCTPSRSALLTGTHPIRSGMQGFPLRSGEPRALPLQIKTLAERLTDLNYDTHLVGKWHLGHQNRSVTPLGRGFRTHFGYWNGYVGYYDYTIRAPNSFYGFDLHDDFVPQFHLSGKYATDLFTDRTVKIIREHNGTRPLFLVLSHLAPHTGRNGTELEVADVSATLNKFKYVKDTRRRLYAELVSSLDTSVGCVINALAERGILNNSLVLFLSDNGGQTVGFYYNTGSNWPLRGMKFTLYEGGVRTVAALWFSGVHSVEDTVFHITDWMPTLYAAAGGNVSTLGPIDGINQWPLLTEDVPKPERPDILLNINEIENYEGILSSDGRFKLIKNSHQNGISDSYFGESGRSDSEPEYSIQSVLNSPTNRVISSFLTPAEQLTEERIETIRGRLDIGTSSSSVYIRNVTHNCSRWCLFDLKLDPLEMENVADQFPDMVKQLRKSLDRFRLDLVPQTNRPVDPNSNPAFCNGSWHTWDDPNPEHKCELNLN